MRISFTRSFSKISLFAISVEREELSRLERIDRRKHTCVRINEIQETRVGHRLSLPRGPRKRLALDVGDDFSGILTLNFAHLSRSSDACWDDNEAVKSSVHRLSTHGVWAARDEKEGKEDRRKRKKEMGRGAKSEKESGTNPWHTRRTRGQKQSHGESGWHTETRTHAA